MIYIHTPAGQIYGIYFDGSWKQSDTAEPTHIAILNDIPETSGYYKGTILSAGDNYFSELYSIFNVTFTPIAPKRIDDMLHTQPITGLGKVKGYEFEYKKRILNQYRRHNAN